MDTKTGLVDYTGADGVEDWRDFIPTRQSPGAVGYDVRACRVLDSDTREVVGTLPYTIPPGGFVLIGTGVRMAVPPGVDAQVRPRSGLATKSCHITLANGPGTIDPDYRGEAGCSMHNEGIEPYTIERGDRIAQLVFTRVLLPVFHGVESADKLPSTTRGDGGFGSTGISGDGFGTGECDATLMMMDVYYMEIVLAASRLSDCVRGCKLDRKGRAKRDVRGQLVGQTRRLGCVFARGNTTVATGYNKIYRGAESCAEKGCLRLKLGIESGTRHEICRATHAEQMAIANAANEGSSVSGCTMYCNAEPCLICAKIIANLDLEAVVILEGGYSSSEGLDVLLSAGIPVRQIPKKWLYTRV